jgi:hypothetical protein
LIVLLAALLFAAGGYMGRVYTMSQIVSDPQSAHVLRGELLQLRDELRDTRGRLEMIQTRREVDTEALGMLRRELAAHKEHATELEEALRFYRNLMAPAEAPAGLNFRPPELVATDIPGSYVFRIVVQQEALKHELVKGTLAVEVLGSLAGIEVSYPLAELSDVSEEVLELQFRYFQSIEGELTLPGGLQPSAISLAAKAEKPRQEELRQLFPWKLQEKFTHVGK